MRNLSKLNKLQLECDKFNSVNPVGSVVTVELDNSDQPFLTTTRSKAEVLSGHTSVIWLSGVRGCYLLDRVRPVSSKQVLTVCRQS